VRVKLYDVCVCVCVCVRERERERERERDEMILLVWQPVYWINLETIYRAMNIQNYKMKIIQKSNTRV